MYRWDGGFIMVSWDKFDEGVEWYTQHLGWECLDKVYSFIGKKAFLKLPGAGVINVKSFETDFEHFQRGSRQEGNVRLCFESGNVEQMLEFFKEQGIQTSEVITLANGQRSFDFYGFENARLTVYENPETVLERPQVYGFGDVCTRIGVTDIEKAIDWYQKHLGFLLVKADAEQGSSHMQTESAYYKNEHNQTVLKDIFLEKVAQGEYVEGDPSVRTYFDIRLDDVLEAYNALIENGIKTSQMAGDPSKGWASFHFFDPDGNRLNVWSYPLM